MNLNYFLGLDPIVVLKNTKKKRKKKEELGSDLKCEIVFN